MLEEAVEEQLGHVPSDFADPDWSQDTGVHEWKAYISDELRVLWPTLSGTLKQVLARDADRLADQEEYD